MGNNGKKPPFGFAGDKFFVNSAQSIGRDQVDAIFENAGADGSIPADQVPADTVLGDVAIRRAIEDRLGVTKRQASNLMDQLPTGVWQRLRMIPAEALEQWAQAYESTKDDEKKKSLKQFSKP